MDAVHKLLITSGKHVLLSNVVTCSISQAKALKQYYRLCKFISANMPYLQAVSANHLHC